MEGEKKKFKRIVDTHNGLIRMLCWQRSWGDENRCRELMQDVYIAIWRRLPSLGDGAGRNHEAAWIVMQCRSVFSHTRRLRVTKWVELDEWDAFMQKIMQQVREGYVFSVVDSEIYPIGCQTNETQPYVTDSEDDANRWARSKVREGYNVTIIYDKKNGEYICIASK